MTRCTECQSIQFNIADAGKDLRRAAHLAQSAHPNAASFAAKIPALKAVLVDAKIRLEEHGPDCRAIA